jgi:hypothetical protein
MRFDGSKWAEISVPLGNNYFRSIAGSSASDVWTSSTSVDGSTWQLGHFDGQRWSLVPTDVETISGTGDRPAVFLSGVWALSPIRAYAVGGGTSASSPMNSVVVKWDGNAWTTISKGMTGELIDIWGTADDNLWAVGYEPCSLSSNCGVIVHFDGVQWSRASVDPVAPKFVSVWGSSPSDVWALGDLSAAAMGTSKVVHWDGSSWKVQFEGPDRTFFNDIHGVAADDFWIVGATNFGTCGDLVCSAIYHYNGSTFVDVSAGRTASIRSVWAASSNNAWAVGVLGDILHWDGQSWSQGALPEQTELTAIWGASGADVWAVGQGILRLK